MTTVVTTSSDLSPVSGRLWAFTIARLVLVVAAVLGLAALPGSLTSGAGRQIAIASALYVAFNGLVLIALRLRVGLARSLLNLSLVIDTVWAALIVLNTGGPGSPMILLFYLQSVGAAVLFGWRTGLKMALVQTIGFLSVVFVQQREVVDDRLVQIGIFEVTLDPEAEGLGGSAARRILMIFGVVSIWLVAGLAGVLARVRERELRRSNQELAVLRELNSHFEHSLELADVCDAIARGVVEELGYERAVVWMAGDGGVLAPAGAAGFGPERVELLSNLRIKPTSGPVGEAIDDRHPVLVPRDGARPQALADAFSIDSPLVVVPLRSEGRPVGVLSVEVAAPVGRQPTVRGRDLRILNTLATEAALALDNARLHQELRDLSVTDALTGVYNHRYFQQRLQEELDRALRQAGKEEPPPVSLILADIDLFKQVNDRFGHPSGDELLKSLARLMKRVLRSSDVVCRYGGEEFGVILPNTDERAALAVADRLREAVERSNFIGADGRHLGQITGSFGVSTYASRSTGRADLVGQADTALYVAKDAGRNAVAIGDRVLPVRFGLGRRLAAGTADVRTEGEPDEPVPEDVAAASGADG